MRWSWVRLWFWKETQSRATSGKEPVMKKVRFVGLDVHAETIAVAIAEPEGEVRSLGTIANRAESIRKLVKKLGRRSSCGPATRLARQAMFSTGSWPSWAWGAM
jgi:hypothetical protein